MCNNILITCHICRQYRAAVSRVSPGADVNRDISRCFFFLVRLQLSVLEARGRQTERQRETGHKRRGAQTDKPAQAPVASCSQKPAPTPPTTHQHPLPHPHPVGCLLFPRPLHKAPHLTHKNPPSLTPPTPIAPWLRTPNPPFHPHPHALTIVALIEQLCSYISLHADFPSFTLSLPPPPN